MKITSEHYNHIKEFIQAKITKETYNMHLDAIKDDPRIKNLDVRMAFDLLYAAVPTAWICDNIYPYANDDHLKTALLKIQKELYS